MKEIVGVCDWPVKDKRCGGVATVLVGDNRPYCSKHGPMVKLLRDDAQSGAFAPREKAA